jgi:predicted HTH domain antitoxin
MGGPAIQYPDDPGGKSQPTDEQRVRLQVSIRLFESGKLSLGKAAEMCGLPKLSFMDELSKLKIPIIKLEGEELEAELNALRGTDRR